MTAGSGFQFLGDADAELVGWKSSDCGFEEVMARERESLHLSFLLTAMTTGIYTRMRCVPFVADAGRGVVPGTEGSL